MSTPTPTPVPAPKREYDQILSGDVTISKVSNGYKIKFSKKNISKVLMYQTWSSTSAALNSDRKVMELKAKDWVKIAFPKNPPAVPYTPTTVMELHDDESCEGKDNKRVFVINNAKVKNGHIVFHVSSKDIDPNSTNKQIKKLKKIPVGEFHNARFDIDGLPLIEFTSCPTSTTKSVEACIFLACYAWGGKGRFISDGVDSNGNGVWNIQCGPT
jgi:hypothetical protein